jgi:hypothetical protein
MSDGPALHEITDDVSLTSGWSLAQAQQFYGEMTRRLSAVMILLDTIPLTELQKVNERMRSSGVLSLPPNVTADQAQAWIRNLRNDQDLYELLLQVLAKVKGQ